MNFSSNVELAAIAVHEMKNLLSHLEIEQIVGPLLVLKELLLNAVVHGNQKNPAQRVCCTIKASPGYRYRIDVEDEGEGFNYGSLVSGIPPDIKHIRWRGY